jgi:hypothetical protein
MLKQFEPGSRTGHTIAGQKHRGARTGYAKALIAPAIQKQTIAMGKIAIHHQNTLTYFYWEYTAQ